MEEAKAAASTAYWHPGVAMVTWKRSIGDDDNCGGTGVVDTQKESLVRGDGWWKTQDIEGQVIKMVQKIKWIVRRKIIIANARG